MPEIIEYCIKLSISLAFVYLFYAGLLRRLTFYHWNRWYLLLYPAMAFLIAFIDISPFVQQNELETSQVIQFIPLFDNYKVENTIVDIDRWTIWDWALLCFVIGVLIMFVRLAIQYFSISRIRSKAKLLLNQPIKVYQVDANIIPFSFGNSIFINQDLHGEEELKEIIRHEFIHIRQKHSVDMIWGELLCIFNWYNPFAWLIRRAIRQNLEFIADDKVLKNGVDRKQYQYLLLKVIGVSQFSIANQFNFSSLKKRIVMMNKMRSARLQLVKFLFIIPLVLVLLLAFRRQQQVVDTIPLSESMNVDTIPIKDKGIPKEFKSIRVVDDVITITLTNSKKEVYSLNSARDQAEFQNKYKRSLESILPPPPPTPAGPPDKLPPNSSKDVPLPPSPPAPPSGPPVKDLPESIGRVDVREFTVTIKRKDGKVETYDLKVTGDLQEFEKKYGRRLEDMVPCTPVTPGKPGEKPKNPVPGKGSVPTKSAIPPTTDLEPPSKTGVPAPVNNGNTAPSKTGLPAFPAPVKKVPTSPTIETTDMNDLKIDASLKGPGNPNKRVSVSIRNLNDPSGAQDPLIIIDGRESPIQRINELKIDPETIESINILKGESSTKAYGAKGQNGVIIITTKKMEPAVKDTTKYRDRITSVNGVTKQWELIKDIKGKKLFMVDKKFLTSNENEFETWLSKNKIHLIEFSSNESDLKKYNLDRNGGIVNAITISNKANNYAYLNPPSIYSPEKMDRIYAEARERNCLFIGIKNPIVFKVEGIETKDLVIKMDDSDQGVFYENGTFNVVPRNGTHGTNLKIDIYKKELNGNLKLLNTRYFRSERLPDPRTFVTT